MNNAFTPPVPNGREELAQVFGLPITDALDARLYKTALPAAIQDVQHVHIHSALQSTFDQTMQYVYAAGLWKYLHDCDGTWNYRNIRVTQGHPDAGLSMHSWAIAIDLNAVHNPLESVPPAAFSEENPFVFTLDHPFVIAMKKWGWFWGGEFHNRKDAMHFQYVTGC